MRGIVALLGFDGKRPAIGSKLFAGVFGVGMLLLGTGFVLQETLFGDITASPPGGPLLFLTVFYAIAFYTLSDFAVGRVASALVGVVRAVMWTVMWGTIVFYLVSHAVAGDVLALGFLTLPPAAAAVLILLTRWWIRKNRRRLDSVQPRSTRPGDR